MEIDNRHRLEPDTLIPHSKSKLPSESVDATGSLKLQSLSATDQAAYRRYAAQTLTDIEAARKIGSSSGYETINYPGAIPAQLSGAGEGRGKLDLRRVTPEMLARMTPAERKQFCRTLANASVVYPPAHRNGHHKLKNALVVLLENLTGQDGGTEMVARLVAHKPEGVKLTRRIAQACSDKFSALLNEMSEGGSKDSLSNENLVVISQVAQTLSKGKDGNKALKELVSKAGRALGESGLRKESQGAVIGSLVAGFIKSGRKVDTGLFGTILRDLTGLIPGAKVGKLAVILLKISIKAGSRAASQGLSKNNDAAAARWMAAIRYELEEEVRRAEEARKRGTPLPPGEEITRDDKTSFLEGLERALNASGILA